MLYSFIEKYEIGCQVLLTYYCRTAPTADSEALAMIFSSASAFGWNNKGTLTRVVCIHSRVLDVVDSKLLRSLMIHTCTMGNKCVVKLTSPRNSCSSFELLVEESARLLPL